MFAELQHSVMLFCVTGFVPEGAGKGIEPEQNQRLGSFPELVLIIALRDRTRRTKIHFLHLEHRTTTCVGLRGSSVSTQHPLGGLGRGTSMVAHTCNPNIHPLRLRRMFGQCAKPDSCWESGCFCRVSWVLLGRHLTVDTS